MIISTQLEERSGVYFPHVPSKATVTPANRASHALTYSLPSQPHTCQSGPVAHSVGSSTHVPWGSFSSHAPAGYRQTSPFSTQGVSGLQGFPSMRGVGGGATGRVGRGVGASVGKGVGPSVGGGVGASVGASVGHEPSVLTWVPAAMASHAVAYWVPSQPHTTKPAEQLSSATHVPSSSFSPLHPEGSWHRKPFSHSTLSGPPQVSGGHAPSEAT